MPLQIDPKHIKSEMTTDAELTAALATKADANNPVFTGLFTAENLLVNGDLRLSRTITPGGTTGNVTINKPAGTVNFAAGAESLTVTNSLVSVNSIVMCVARRNDINATVWAVTPANGSFTIQLSGPPDAELSVGFIVFN